MFQPHEGDYVVGFVHAGGAPAVRIADARFPRAVEVVPVDAADAADVALIWHLAELVLVRGLPHAVPVVIVSTDHVFVTLAAWLRARGAADVRCVAAGDAALA